MSAPRLMTAMVTPYGENLQIDLAKAAVLAEYLYDNASEGIVVCGTTGESPVLSNDEKLQLFAAVKEKIGNKIPVWAGTGSNHTDNAIELSRNAEKTGVDGIMLVTPYYNKPSQEGLYRHFKAIAESISLPVMLYNVPGRTSCNLLPETVKRLSAIDNIVAIKEASGNMDQVSLLKSLVGEDILIYSGDDSLTLPMLALGVHGVVSIASHLAGKEISEMIGAFANGDNKKASSIHAELFPLFRALFVTTNPVPLKEALNMLGMDVGGLRLPLCAATADEKRLIREMLIRHNLLTTMP